MKNKIEYILKHNSLILNTYRIVFSTFFRFIGLFIKTDEKLILFNANSKRYNDSPKAIYEYMVKKSLDKQYNIFWAFDKINKYEVIGKHKEVKIDTLKYFITALKAKYWVASVNIERGLSFKKNKTIFLNTWHGIAINKMGNDVSNRTDFDWSKTNFICFSNDEEIEIYKKAFNAKKENMIACGLARNDELYNVTKEEISLIKNKLNIPENKKIILYAPTWRDSEDVGKNYSLKPPINWSFWQKELKDDYIILLRTHPYTTKLMDVEFNDFIRDYSNYPKINDLLKISDILISDYSSIFFDYCILERPIFCFGYDYDIYKEKRGFYYDLNEELPNGVIKKEEELLSKIKNINYQQQVLKTKKLKEKHVKYGKDATKKCLEYLFGVCENEN